MLPRLAQMPGLSGKVKKILKKKTGAETPEESQEMDDLFKKLTKEFNGLRDPAFTQPKAIENRYDIIQRPSDS